MQFRNKEKGLTAISIMVLIVIFSFVAISMIKILPVYFDAFKVDDVVSTMKDTRGLGNKTNNEIARIILDKLSVNQVSDISRDDIFIEKIKNDVLIEIEYEARRQMFGNLDVVISFKKSVEASAI